MPEWSEILQAQKSASTVLVLFVPSVASGGTTSVAGNSFSQAFGRGGAARGCRDRD
jgi:hypothetical protein